MKKLYITESHLATIVNALNGMSDTCIKEANSADITTQEGRYVFTALNQSAGQYKALADMINNAEEIVVEK